MKSTILCTLMLLLAGCGLYRPAFERQTFLVAAERPAGQGGRQLPGRLSMGRVEVAPPFDGRAFVYRRDEVRYETDFYNGFAADPADMLAGAASGWLARSGLFAAVQGSGLAPAGDYRLEASVSAMYIDFRHDPPVAELALQWRLLRLGAGGEKAGRLLSLDCEERAALPERSPRGAALAYDEAVKQALARLEAAVAGSAL